MLSAEEYVRRLIFDGAELAKLRTEVEGRPLPQRAATETLLRTASAFSTGKEERLVILSGLRGTGKTVMLFQLYRYLTEELDVPLKNVLYVSADASPYSIREILEAFARLHGYPSPTRIREKLYLLVDEAHYDGEWGRTAKYIYDVAPRIFCVYTGSSALLMNSNPDVVRRSVRIRLRPLSFQEYLMIRTFWEGKTWEPDLELRGAVMELLLNPTPELFYSIKSRAAKLFDRAENVFSLEIENLFLEFLLYGGFPHSQVEPKILTQERIREVVRRIVEADLPRLRNIESKTVLVAKKVLLILTTSAPGPVSINSLAGKLGTSPSVVARVLDLLKMSGIIFDVPLYSRSSKTVLRPPKLYFASPSIVAALTYTVTPTERTKGLLLETAVANALLSLKETRGLQILYTTKGPDFIVGNDKARIEVGWRKRSPSQLKGRGFLVTTSPEAEFDRIVKIPAWWLA